jgi:chromate transport protein ChrA
MKLVTTVARELWAITERFAWMLVMALVAIIVFGVLVGSPSAWVLLAVGVIGVLGYGEYLIRRRRPSRSAGERKRST